MTETVIKKTEYAQITQKFLADDFAILAISHPKFEAQVSVYGGHVLTWQPAGEKPVLWLSDTAEYVEGKAIRGGIPICWPWFGPFLDKNGHNNGNHGFARNSNWVIDKLDIDKDSVTVVLTFSGREKHDAWSHEFEVKQTLVFSQDLSQQLAVTNCGTKPIRHGHALHTYFTVSNPENITVDGLTNKIFDDKISGKLQQKDTLTNCVGPLDRIYYNSQSQQIHDSKWQRTIKVTSENSHQWVLWNPGKDIAQGMADVHVNGENEYVCLEAANTQWQEIAVNQTMIVGQKIQII